MRSLTVRPGTAGGRSDLIGFFFGTAADEGGGFSLDAVAPILATGELAEDNHDTRGYPTFASWPDPAAAPTHQMMYYRWVERAWMNGLRLMVQHASGNSVLCELMTGLGSQPVRYSCNDMVSVDRQIEEVRAMERYIDAQNGGPGQGFFRVVESPAEAREAVASGKLAVVLGIEISNLFDCYHVPKPGVDTCTPESVDAKLDHYYSLGVRAVFPVHKYDNAFSPGDGNSGIIEHGNFVNSGYYSSFVEECSGPVAHFDYGQVTFPALNQPREEYGAPPPHDLSGLGDDAVGTLLPFLNDFLGEPLQGDYCQKHTMTPLGESLMYSMMARGMLVGIAHFPRRALGRAYELLVSAGYPATKTHGISNDGQIYEIGGMNGSRLGKCADPEASGQLISDFLSRVAERASRGAYPAEALSFDYNGFAPQRGPRFGDKSACGEDQANPVEWPFTSYDGAVTFTKPRLGDREVDFNTEGMIHIGLLRELIQDARLDGASDDDLEPLFRSAEAYIRMWEAADAWRVP